MKSKRTLKFSRTAKLLNGDGVEEKDGREEVPTARKSASNAACAGDVVTAAGGGEKRLRRDKDSPPHQGLAQRKFATNHTPPVRYACGSGDLLLCLHEGSNPDSTHFWSQTEFQSTNGYGLSQPRLQSGFGGVHTGSESGLSTG